MNNQSKKGKLVRISVLAKSFAFKNKISENLTLAPPPTSKKKKEKKTNSHTKKPKGFLQDTGLGNVPTGVMTRQWSDFERNLVASLNVGK